MAQSQSLYRYQAMNKRKNPLADKLFGAATTANPLNCKKCGSKNLRYSKGIGNEIKANCNDCDFGFEVAKAIAPYLQHLTCKNQQPSKQISLFDINPQEKNQ